MKLGLPITISFQAILPSFRDIRPADCMGALAGTLLSFIFSPTWLVMALLLSPYFDLDHLRAHPLDIPLIIRSVAALPREVIFFKLIPALLFCKLVSLATLFFYAWLGRKVSRYFWVIPAKAGIS